MNLQQLFSKVARAGARPLLALWMLVAVCAPFVHAAAEIGQHEECSQEMCKRSGKCCCRRNNAGKPHFSTRGICRAGGAQLPGSSTPVAAILSAIQLLPGLVPAAAELPFLAELATPGSTVSILRFQRPPPRSL
jgi:hypothetical protein